jgi:transmembrane sensor
LVVKWKNAMVREVLTRKKLDALGPRAAAAYFIMRRAEGLTSGEEQLLADWLARDESHRRIFENTDRSCRVFADAEGDEILAAMRAHARAPRRRGWMTWRPAIAAAAVLLLAVGTALFLVPGLNPWAPGSQQPGAVTGEAIQYASARGEVKDLQLPDGSAMALDADSVAVGHFTAASRSVDLQRGRAFFEVMPDRSRPFAVRAADRSIVAVGTRFDVNLGPDGVTVTLLEGHVRIESADRAQAPVLLEPGQQYIERQGQATLRTVGAASDNAVSWRNGLLSFDDQPLADAAAVMNRYSKIQIVIRDPAVAAIRVTGQFRAGEAERFAATLAELHKLRVIRRTNEIELVRQ